MEIRKFENGSYIIADHLTIGRNFRIGPNTTIRATSCIIGDDVTLGANNAFLVGQKLTIGNLTIFGNANNLTARTIHIGEYVYWDSNVVVGHGGKFSEDAHLRVGSYSMICARITLNVNHAISIGEYVGIGEDVAVWTHGSYLPILEGFPADFGPVNIGNKVWLPAKSTVLPNRRIGNNVVIGTNSLINKDLPDGCLAGGIPVKILRENFYPCHDSARDEQLVQRIIHDYEQLAVYKQLNVQISYQPATHELRCNEVVFHLDTMLTQGVFTAVEEDFRDFLRRRGIKFYTGQPFSSILPEEYRRLLAVSPDSDGVE
ncbi:acyltransferase [Hymenobacter sp. BT730]|uniref:acyltransferase n=1 Tax=Hymenobacter sp. BT730 TaxID=3063332 RepID=UPI0026E1057D|nr:acyltransferase [Hymenobacter sp. BT730]